MITKAIVEEVVSPYRVKIRIPILDKIDSSVLSVENNSLTVATICSLPSCYVNIQVGDIVFVAFEDNTYHKAVVLGHLCREATNSCIDITIKNLETTNSCKLPYNTTIGEVRDAELSHLCGLRDNIQKQIDSLNTRLEFLYNEVGIAEV